MIAVQTIKDDISTNHVLDWIFFLKNGQEILRLNDEITINGLSIDDNVVLTLGDEDYDLTDVSKYWYRRGGFRASKGGDLSWADIPFYKEINSVYSKLNLFGNNFSLGKLSNNSIDKIQMLLLARYSGLEIPKTIVTGNYKKLNAFLSLCNGRVITKAIDNDDVEIFNTSEYTCNLCLSTKLIDPERFSDIHLEDRIPALFQQYIDKKYEIRVFYLHGKFYSMAIFSQQNEKTKIDFRNYDREFPNRTIPYSLPDSLKEKIEVFMKAMDLNTGSLDLIFSADNQYVFLEVNPIGQYEWVEKNCNFPISREIAKELLRYE